MSNESRSPIERPALRAHATQAAMQYQFTLRLILLATPFMLAFRAAGATPMVAMLAGIAVTLPIAAPWLMPKGVVLDVDTQRGVLLASGAMLLTACGVQALVWRLGLSTHTAGVFILVCITVLAVVLLIVEVARPPLKRVWRRLQTL
jgi:hypothetical protein